VAKCPLLNPAPDSAKAGLRVRQYTPPSPLCIVCIASKVGRIATTRQGKDKDKCNLQSYQWRYKFRFIVHFPLESRFFILSREVVIFSISVAVSINFQSGLVKQG